MVVVATSRDLHIQVQQIRHLRSYPGHLGFRLPVCILRGPSCSAVRGCRRRSGTTVQGIAQSNYNNGNCIGMYIRVTLFDVDISFFSVRRGTYNCG